MLRMWQPVPRMQTVHPPAIAQTERVRVASQMCGVSVAAEGDRLGKQTIIRIFDRSRRFRFKALSQLNLPHSSRPERLGNFVTRVGKRPPHRLDISAKHSLAICFYPLPRSDHGFQ